MRPGGLDGGAGIRGAGRTVAALALGVVVAHLLVNALGPYGFHRDEFLYLAMGEHLRLFRMDVPPLIAVFAEASRLLGDSLVAIRLLPALAHGALVVMAGLLAAAFGGGRWAAGLAALAVVLSPLFLRVGNLFQPVIFDQLWWTLALYALVRLGGEGWPGRSPWWWALGAAGGLGLLTKFSIGFVAVGIVAGLLVTGARQTLRTRGPWLALALAAAIGAPSLVGQLVLDWPSLTYLRGVQQGQLVHVSRVDFVAEQVLMFGPAFLLAGLGLAALLRSPRFERWRAVGWACLVAFLVLLALRGKPYYAGPIYPALFAAGAAALERWSRRATRVRLGGGVRAAAVGLVALYGAVVLPLGLPAFSPEFTARHAARLGVTSAVTTNTGTVLPLPQDYADMLGWEAQVAAVADVWRSLPPSEREGAVIVGTNYGRAGAVDFYGPRYGLPEPVAPVGSYWFFGPGDEPGDPLIVVGGTREELDAFCGALEAGARVEEPWVVPEERGVVVWICREPRRTLQEMWPDFRGAI